MAGKFELYTDKAGKFRWRLKAGNGEIIATSEGYSSKAGAKNGIDRSRRTRQAPRPRIRHSHERPACTQPCFARRPYREAILGGLKRDNVRQRRPASASPTAPPRLLTRQGRAVVLSRAD